MELRMRALMPILHTFIAVTASETQPCPTDMSVELRDRSYNGILYNEGEFFVDNTTGLEQGCICMKEKCLRKCCKLGEVYDRKNRKCMESNEPFNPPVWANNNKLEGYNISDNFHLIFGKQKCTGLNEARYHMKPSFHVYMLKPDGNLLIEDESKGIEWTVYTPEKYCMDIMVNDEGNKPTDGVGFNALICYAPEEEKREFYLSSICMLISCFFILLTLMIYVLIPELRNLHGMVMIAYLSSFFMALLFLATLQIGLIWRSLNVNACVVLTFVVYFSLLAAFFWLNVMCFNMWMTFSGKRGTSVRYPVKSSFLRYCAYSFGVPTILTVLMAILEFVYIPVEHVLLPNLRAHGCFLTGYSKLLYLYGPLTILCLANIVFFVMTVRAIFMIRKQVQKVLQTTESSTNDAEKKERFSTYLKLFAMMGVSWILEVVSSLDPEIEHLFVVSDVYNALIGLIIFIIVVCKKSTFKLLQKKFNKSKLFDKSSTTTVEEKVYI